MPPFSEWAVGAIAMTRKPSPTRPAIAAIAVSIAVLSTPAIAQQTTPAPAPAMQPAPTVAPPALPANAAPTPRTPAPAPVTIRAPVTAAAPNLTLPDVDVEAAQASSENAAPASSAVTANRQVRQAAVQARQTRSTPVTASDTPGAAIASAVSPAETERAQPDTETLADAEPLLTDESIAPATIEQASANEGDDDALVLAALAGILGLGAIGGGIALSRRRRDGATVAPEPVDFEPEGAVAPRSEPVRTTSAVGATAAAPAPRRASSDAMRERLGITPMPAKYAATDRPIGYYESMVDEGPTPENPFLTRRKRLVRARFLDKQVARNAEQRRSSRATPELRTRELEPA